MTHIPTIHVPAIGGQHQFAHFLPVAFELAESHGCRVLVFTPSHGDAHNIAVLAESLGRPVPDMVIMKLPRRTKAMVPDAARKLRFRATITDVVRECNYAGEFLTMKVGVAGRVVSGPGGETGELLMPIRVAATQGQTVLYSKLHDVPVVLSPGRPNTRFSYVDAQVVIPKPERENIVVYVGYDEQRVDNPASVVRVDGSQQPEELQPVN